MSKPPTESLGSEAECAEIAKTNSNGNLRIAALDQVTSQHLIDDIARNSIGSNLRIRALQRVQTGDVLQEIIATDEDPRVRVAALQRLAELDGKFELLTGEFLTKQLAQEAWTMRLATIELIAQQVQMQQMGPAQLVATALLDPVEEVSKRAFAALPHSRDSEQIARNSVHPSVRIAALEHIANPDVRLQICLEEGFEQVQKKACEGLGDVGLQDLFNADVAEALKVHAVEQIEQFPLLISVARQRLEYEHGKHALLRLREALHNALASQSICPYCNGSGKGRSGGTLAGGSWGGGSWSHRCEHCDGYGHLAPRMESEQFEQRVINTIAEVLPLSPSEEQLARQVLGG